MKSINTFIKFGALFRVFPFQRWRSRAVSRAKSRLRVINLLHNATVQIVQLKRTVQTADDGSYKFEGVPRTIYDFGSFRRILGFSPTIVLVAGANSTVDFSLQLTGVTEQVTVTASGTEQSTFDSFQSVNSVPGTSITQRASTSLGEVLWTEKQVFPNEVLGPVLLYR